MLNCHRKIKKGFGMDVIEKDAMLLTNSELKSFMCGLSSDYRPVLLRNGIKRMSQDKWFVFLKVECGFKVDSRHPVGDSNNWKLNDSYKVEHKQWGEISYQPGKATSYAFSKTRQPLHTDNAFLKDSPDLNFNIMVKQAVEGGFNTVYPVHKIINDLSELNPLLLEKLLKNKVKVQKGEGAEANETYILQDVNGGLADWNFYRTIKDSPTINSMCEEFFQFLEDSEQAGRVEKVLMETGDCLIWNDKRIFHGRTSFEAQEPFDRVLRQSMWHFV